VFKVGVGVDIINELLRKSGGRRRLVLGGVFQPLKELEIKNTLFFLKY